MLQKLELGDILDIRDALRDASDAAHDEQCLPLAERYQELFERFDKYVDELDPQ
jgi:hypothetical protein